jgi:hypothetical protein
VLLYSLLIFINLNEFEFMRNISFIGAIYTFLFACLGVIIAYLIFSAMAGTLLWILRISFLPSILIGILFVMISSFHLGKLSAYFIVIKRINSILFGILTTFLVVIISTFFGSLLMFFQEGIFSNRSLCYEINSYIFNPIIAIFIFGLIPNIILGIFLGLKLKKKLTISPVGTMIS